MNRNLTLADLEHKILNTFKYYRQGPSVPSDGNCGLHAICKALDDGFQMSSSNTKPTSLMLNIFCMFDLDKLPNYWWSDEELAVIANYFGYDMYIYNETDRTGIVFGKGVRPPLVLYSVNNNSHWIPGMKTLIPSSSVPENFTIIENISEVLSIKQIKNKIKGHLLMRSLNPSGGCIESYSVKCDRIYNSSSGRRVFDNNRRNNGSFSGGDSEKRDRNVIGRYNESPNKRLEEIRSGGRNVRRSNGGPDGVRIVKQNGSRPQSEEDRGGEVKISHSRGEKGSHGRREEILSRESDESCSSTVNGGHRGSMNVVKQQLNLYAKLKNTMLSKMVRQLGHWHRSKENKYKKLDLFESEDEDDDFENVELDAMFNVRYTVMRDMLHHFVSKNEHKLLMLETCETSMPQSLEPTMFQSEPIKYPQLELVQVKCPMGDVNCSPIVAADYCPIEPIDCCSIRVVDCCMNADVDCSSTATVDYFSNAVVDCCSNAVVDCPFLTSDCPFTSTNCQCTIADCPFTAPEYPCSDKWVNDNYVSDLFDSYTFGRNKNTGVQLFSRVYNQTLAMRNNIIVRCIVKPKRAMEVSSAVASVLVAPAVAASVVASPPLAAWVAPELASSVMQVAPAMAAPAIVALMMVVPEVATPKMVKMTVEVATPGNDLVAASLNNNLAAAPMEKNMTVASVGSNPVVKPNTSIRRYFSLKKIWPKKMY